MKIRWALVVLVSITLLPAMGYAALCQNLSGPADVFDNFETTNTNMMGGDVFVLGTNPPGTATFEGMQWAGIAGIGELYFSGLHAWMVLPNGVGTITFDPPAAEVLFQAKTLSTSTGNSVIESLDPGDVVIDTVVLPAGMPAGIPPAAGFQQVCLTGTIASIEVTNNDALVMNAIDDIAYIAPEPSAALTAAVALLTVFGVGARKRKERLLDGV